MIPFGIISTLFGTTYAVIEKGILGDAAFYPSTGNPYSFGLISSFLMSLVAGLFIGVFEIAVLNKRFQHDSFFRKIFLKTLIYIAFMVLLIFMISVVSHSLELKKSPWDPEVNKLTTNFLFSFAFWSIELYMALGISTCLFYLEVSDNIGQSVLINFFTGKYHHPIEEDRIFMFLDMKDSTTFAEELGHMQYFDMLKRYYADLTYPIVAHGGQIYQYVGDEVVVTWDRKKGVQNGNCIKCFLAMRAALRNKAEDYRAKYGVAPSFKAGIHLGNVTSGEIGTVKKDIIFSGDVLNTTARVQGLCNTYQVDLLVTEQLNHALENHAFEFNEIGNVSLKGREERVTLYSLRQES